MLNLFCRHTKVKVIRWHPDVVPEKWKGKELYTDRHNVSNFVMCCSCGKVLQGMQVEQLYDTKEVKE